MGRKATWESTVKMGNKLNRDLIKLERVMHMETRVRDALKATSGDPMYKPVLQNLRASLEGARSVESLKGRSKQLKAFSAYFNKTAGEITTWPPPKLNVELSAMTIVNILTDEQFMHRITSAEESGFVTSTTNFWNKTIKEALQSDAIPSGDKGKFIAAINKYIDIKNPTLNSSDKVRKISEYWFRNVK